MIPYRLYNNIYYFCHIYNSYQKIIFRKYSYNSSSFLTTYVGEKSFVFTDLCPNDYNFVSCQLIVYKNKTALICFFTNHLTDKYINMKIYDINNYNVLDTTSFGSSASEINTAKNHLKSEQKVLLITRSLNWVGISILENTYKKESGTITLIN